MTSETARWIRVVGGSFAPAVPVFLWIALYRQAHPEPPPSRPLLPPFFLNPRTQVDRTVPDDIRSLSSAAFRDAVWTVFDKNQSGQRNVLGLREAFGKSRLQWRLKWTSVEWAGYSGPEDGLDMRLYCQDALESKPSWTIQIHGRVGANADVVNDLLLGDPVYFFDGKALFRKVALIDRGSDEPKITESPSDLRPKTMEK